MEIVSASAMCLTEVLWLSSISFCTVSRFLSLVVLEGLSEFDSSLTDVVPCFNSDNQLLSALYEGTLSSNVFSSYLNRSVLVITPSGEGI